MALEKMFKKDRELTCDTEVGIKCKSFSMQAYTYVRVSVGCPDRKRFGCSGVASMPCNGYFQESRVPRFECCEPVEMVTSGQ
jgi:hypothetical protein